METSGNAEERRWGELSEMRVGMTVEVGRVRNLVLSLIINVSKFVLIASGESPVDFAVHKLDSSFFSLHNHFVNSLNFFGVFLVCKEGKLLSK
jgi:hypothetical protein